MNKLLKTLILVYQTIAALKSYQHTNWPFESLAQVPKYPGKRLVADDPAGSATDTAFKRSERGVPSPRLP